MHIWKSAIKECLPLPVSVCVSGAGCATQERVCSRSKLERGRWSTSESTQPPWPSPSNMRGWWRRWRRAYRYIRASVRRPWRLRAKQGVCSCDTPAGKKQKSFYICNIWLNIINEATHKRLHCFCLVTPLWLPMDLAFSSSLSSLPPHHHPYSLFM